MPKLFSHFLAPSISAFVIVFSHSSLLSLSVGGGGGFLYFGCTPSKYSPGSAYESNLNSLFTSLVNSAAHWPYNNFSIGQGADTVRGIYQCRGGLLAPEDCTKCVVYSVSRFTGGLCLQTDGGFLQLNDCFVKYDSVNFIGYVDKSEMYKKCGPPLPPPDGGWSEADLMNRRDAVLANLSGPGGLFRIGGSREGNAMGMAQCVGDLSFVDCQDCLTEAIGRLKMECGGATFGDVFLGKCYARYVVHETDQESPWKQLGLKRGAVILGCIGGLAFLAALVSSIIIKKFHHKRRPRDIPSHTKIIGTSNIEVAA